MRVEMLLLIAGAGISAVSQLLLKISANRNSAGGPGNPSDGTVASNGVGDASGGTSDSPGGVSDSSGSISDSPGDAAKVSLVQRFRAQYLNPLVIGGYALLLIAMVIPLYALKFIDMKFAAIFESLGYVFIMVLSAVVLRERITRRLVVGIVLIVAGVIVFGSHII
ncbi:MAG: DMT family transporter [Clostridiales Family XIII bacterium]|jgi:multidrug transporter EmrE-like cation transporter|nr:DMT family transporter [Clostridiales Family XIII bacterium]